MFMHSKTIRTLSSIHTYALSDLSNNICDLEVMSGDAASAGLGLSQPLMKAG